MRIIDADRLKEVFRRNTGHDYSELIDIQPTVDVLEHITAEIYEHFMTIDGGVHDKSAIKCMEIIGKYRGDKE